MPRLLWHNQGLDVIFAAARVNVLQNVLIPNVIMGLFIVNHVIIREQKTQDVAIVVAAAL